jgi:hypothetical protein
MLYNYVMLMCSCINNEHGSLPFDWIFYSLRTRTALKSHVTPYSDNDQ